MRQQLRRAIHRIFLANAAQIDFHPVRQGEPGALPDDLVPADARQQRIDGRLGRQAVAAIKAPRRAQNARGDIEHALAQLVTLPGIIEQGGQFVVHLHRRAVRMIDAVDGIVIPVTAEGAFDAPGFVAGDSEQLLRQGAIIDIHEDFARAGHGLKAAGPVITCVFQRSPGHGACAENGKGDMTSCHITLAATKACLEQQRVIDLQVRRADEKRLPSKEMEPCWRISTSKRRR